MNLLNLGCGQRFHPAWTNLDYAAGDPSVLCHDLRQGIPFPDEKFDVVYHSHLLEHFPKASAPSFLRECYRVLKRGGVVRVAVPDLERITKVYLQALEGAASGSEEWRHNYDWMTLELYDQTVRERSGGEMATYLQQEKIPNTEFVLSRMGIEAEQIIKEAGRLRSGTPAGASRAQSFWGRMLSTLTILKHDKAYRREAMIRRVLGDEYKLLQAGRFRNGGEVHLWMYDRYSLARILREAGFNDPRPVDPTESRIPRWIEYNLDAGPDGAAHKPDSLYMEALK